MSFPDTVDGLIDLLDRTFPEPAIGPDDTMDKIKYDAGQRAVITWLKRRRQQALAERFPSGPKKRGEGRRVPRQETKDYRA